MRGDPLAVRDEATQYLHDLVRIDTTNPPGNEMAAAEYLAAVFKREGIEPLVLESAPGRGNLVARLKGDGRAPPLLLMSHLDVVPAEADQWTHPPFSGDVADGYVWGRGTLDTKELTVMELMTVLMLHREGRSSPRDIIFMANADEEAGGKYGAVWMVQEHADLVRAQFAINEGGGFGIDLLGHRFFTCQVAEKGTARFILRARGRPGHGSQPHRDNSVLKLAAAIQKIGAAEFPVHGSQTVKLFVEAIARQVGRPYEKELPALLDGRRYRDAMERLPLDEGVRSLLYAMLHNTVTPTMLRAGSKVNVIPSVAEARCDARLVPGQSSQDLLHELRGVVGSGVEIEFLDGSPALEADFESPLYDTIGRVMARHEPNAPVVPYLVVGATDARHVRKLGMQVYGFCPMVSPASELDRIHGHDERIAVENLAFGATILHEVVSEFCEIR